MRMTRKWYKLWWHVDGELAFRRKWMRDLWFKPSTDDQQKRSSTGLTGDDVQYLIQRLERIKELIESGEGYMAIAKINADIAALSSDQL